MLVPACGMCICDIKRMDFEVGLSSSFNQRPPRSPSTERTHFQLVQVQVKYQSRAPLARHHP